MAAKMYYKDVLYYPYRKTTTTLFLLRYLQNIIHYIKKLGQYSENHFSVQGL